MIPKTEMVKKDTPLYAALLEIYKDEHQPSTVMLDGRQYEVLTPEGKDESQFADHYANREPGAVPYVYVPPVLTPEEEAAKAAKKEKQDKAAEKLQDAKDARAAKKAADAKDAKDDKDDVPKGYSDWRG